MKEITQCMISGLFGAIFIFVLLSQPSQTQAHPAVIFEPHIQTIECDTIKDINPKLRENDSVQHAINRLAFNCEQNEAHLLLIQTWQQQDLPPLED